MGHVLFIQKCLKEKLQYQDEKNKRIINPAVVLPFFEQQLRTKTSFATVENV